MERKGISVETQVAVTLYHLLDEERYPKVANVFEISRSVVSVIFCHVCFVISKHMGPKYKRLPSTEEEVRYAAERFEAKTGFP